MKTDTDTTLKTSAKPDAVKRRMQRLVRLVVQRFQISPLTSWMWKIQRNKKTGEYTLRYRWNPIIGVHDFSQCVKMVAATQADNPECMGCRHLQCSGYAFWCEKDGCKCTRGGNPKQEGCFEPNAKADSQPPNQRL